MYRLGNHYKLLITLALISTIFVFWGGIENLLYRWLNDDNYSHGILIPFISIYFIWQKRFELAAQAFNPSWLSHLVFGLPLTQFAGEFFDKVLHCNYSTGFLYAKSLGADNRHNCRPTRRHYFQLCANSVQTEVRYCLLERTIQFFKMAVRE